jgi:hypothetical protein
MGQLYKMVKITQLKVCTNMPLCSSNDCPNIYVCAQHIAAGEVRLSEGKTPNLYLEGELYFCKQNTNADNGALMLIDNKLVLYKEHH